MASNIMRGSLKRSALAVAMGLCFVGGVQAQTNTAGAVAGRAAAGDTITITNPSTGFTRTVTVGNDGGYRFSQLPTGQYQVTRNGGAARSVTVNVGTSSSVDFVTGKGADAIDSVTVVGTAAVNPIDVTSVESTTVLTAEQVTRLPVARNTTSVALLAPGTVRGATNVGAFASLPSIGGSSVAENQFYINGLNITNTFKNLSFAQVPFQGIAETQVKTGGYGAEFGRSTGGVINMITKRGTNEFHAGGNIIYIPESLSETSPNYYYNDGRLISDNSKDNGWSGTASIWAGGALVKDRLFYYALIQYGKSQSDAYPGTLNGISGGSNTHSMTTRPQWLAKIDWDINDSNRLELTAFSDESKGEDAYYRTTFGVAGAPTSTPTRGAYQGTDFFESGGRSWALKYTGYYGDNFTLSALYGEAQFRRYNYGVSAGGVQQLYTGNLQGAVPGCPVITDARTEVTRGTISAEQGCYFLTTMGRKDAEDNRKQFRVDAEWQLGSHLLRGGIDIDNFKSVDGLAYSGGAAWRYYGAAANKTVRYRSFRTGADLGVNQRAFYIEDTWSVTDNFRLYFGARWDTFENVNGEGETFIQIKNQFAPRLGLSWDVYGDSSFKVFANAGRYALPVTAGVASRAASASLYEEIYYRYDSIDPVTGAPVNPVRIVNPSTGSLATRYLNGEDGNPKYAAGYASQNLSPMYQDEYIVGFQKQMTDHFSLGVRGIRRDLKAAIDDYCDYDVQNYVQSKGGVYNPGTQYNYCMLFNPGKDLVIKGDVNGDGNVEITTIPADLISEKAKRKYTAVEFFWQGNWDRLMLQGSYTYAKAKGNTEGGVRSDNGQTDTGTTSDFDYKEAMIGAYGYGPNDRRHAFKLFGNYEFTDEFSLGFNYLIQSGRPQSCIGVYKGLNVSHYGNIHFSCDTGAPNAQGDNGSTIVPRGTVGRTPWISQLDLSVAYAPNWLKGLRFQADVFNVFNSRKVLSTNEVFEDASGNPAPQAPSYGTPSSWQTPRYVRFLVQYDF